MFHMQFLGQLAGLAPDLYCIALVFDEELSEYPDDESLLADEIELPGRQNGLCNGIRKSRHLSPPVLQCLRAVRAGPVRNCHPCLRCPARAARTSLSQSYRNMWWSINDRPLARPSIMLRPPGVIARGQRQHRLHRYLRIRKVRKVAAKFGDNPREAPLVDGTRLDPLLRGHNAERLLSGALATLAIMPALAAALETCQLVVGILGREVATSLVEDHHQEPHLRRRLADGRQFPGRRGTGEQSTSILHMG